jgi:3',5'-cyclic-AMP phosphodiesterase
MGNDIATQADFSFVHLTDTHIMAGGKWKARSGAWEYDTTASLQQVINAVNILQPRPAFAVLGGDLASPDLLDHHRVWTPEEYESSYILLQELLHALPCPTYMLMGNHDNRIAFHRILGNAVSTLDAPHYYSFDYQRYHFVALDSQQPGAPGGYLDPAQLTWLRQDLETYRDQPTLVFVHHHPWPLGLAWIDTMPLHNGEELMRLLQMYPAVRWVICGHVHTDQVMQRDGITVMTTPSTCVQLSKVSQTPKILPGPPGFRLVQVKGLALSTRVFYLHGTDAEAL